ncbi:hypothetical protein TPCCA_0425 [Treponema paraluiscuniculi Cuniculi A]|uniref:Uncharacterized protein n=2 Tax=Treponema paraluiscuniculi TaxID=53435 RepID=F7XSN5_TREPU|nr:hypothetical protein [Treponema paraluiscuniculi]AEH40368.1 hypothetical protein TPCCA_0425 [Treponema paraluiscuniculi Cuniculi A]WKC72296.1 hypothetical protein TPLL2_0425 [Treponema paraluiscuniculi]
MSSHCYLITQLPSLLCGAVPPLRYQDFLDCALRFLGRQDAAVLGNISLCPVPARDSTGSRVLDRWGEFEYALRCALARERADRLRWDIPVEVRQCPMAQESVARAARVAVSLDDPLEAEYFLNDARFSFVEGCRPLDPFSSEAVFLYGLQLMLLTHRSRFTMQAGSKAYAALYYTILGAYT